MRSLLLAVILLAVGLRVAMKVPSGPPAAPAAVGAAQARPAPRWFELESVWARRLIRFLATLGGVLAALILLLLLMENRFIYYPSRYPEGDWMPAGLPVRDCAIRTSDGLKLHGWWLPPDDPGAPVLLWFHGNAGNITHRAENMALMHAEGLGVLIVDYRGYGKSEGRPSEQGLYLDGEAAYEHLTRELGVPPERIILFGRSLGCAVAVQVAVRRPAAGVILESPFAGARAMARRMFPVLPLGPFVRSKFDNIGLAPRLRVPLLVLHGDRDEIVPFEQGRAVFEAAPEPKEFYTIPGAGHNDTYATGGEDYWRAFAGFCRRCVEQED